MSSTLARRTLRAAPAALPARIGGWSIERQIGAGRWTRVFAARPADCSQGRAADYAVKVLTEAYRDDDRARGMLRREAALGKALTHPNLTAVLGAGDHEGLPYVVTPLLAGQTLETLNQQCAPLEAPRAFWFARQAAEALAALHEAGWMHGDVKPQNIFVSPQGHVTLLDLGLARRFDARGRAASEPLQGSLAYCAPESFTPHVGTSGRSDVYSLGVTLFRALTGRLPFPQTDPAELAAAHLQAALPDVRRAAPQAGNRAARLLRAMLAKEPLRRPSAEELIDWLCDLEIDTLGECGMH